MMIQLTVTAFDSNGQLDGLFYRPANRDLF